MHWILLFHPQSLGFGILFDAEENPMEFTITFAFWTFNIHWHDDEEEE